MGQPNKDEERGGSRDGAGGTFLDDRMFGRLRRHYEAVARAIARGQKPPPLPPPLFPFGEPAERSARSKRRPPK